MKPECIDIFPEQDKKAVSSLIKSVIRFLSSTFPFKVIQPETRHGKSIVDSRTESDNDTKVPTYSITENKSSSEEDVRPEKGKADDQSNQSAVLDSTSESLAEKPEEITPDVYLDVPSLKVQELKLNVEDLDAKVALNAVLAGLIKINVGVNVGIKKLELDIKDVEVKAILKVRLKQVYHIFDRALNTIDKNPELLNNKSIPMSENPVDFQNGSTKNSAHSNAEITNKTGDGAKKNIDQIEAHHSIKKGEERNRFRMDQ